jgi:hypothetical protein
MTASIKVSIVIRLVRVCLYHLHLTAAAAVAAA